jgi:hypothetical protein
MSCTIPTPELHDLVKADAACSLSGVGAQDAVTGARMA